MAMNAAENARIRAALRGATRVGASVRVLGWPSIACEGELVIGARVVFVSTPGAVTLVVERGASIEIGDETLLESGATIRARKRVVVGAGARIGVGCVIDDAASDAPELRIEAGAWLADGAIIDGRAVTASAKSNGANGLSGNSANGHADARLRAVIASIVRHAARIGTSDDLRQMPGWDSLAALRVVVALEKELGVMLPHDLFAQPRTLDALGAIVRGEATP